MWRLFIKVNIMNNSDKPLESKFQRSSLHGTVHDIQLGYCMVCGFGLVVLQHVENGILRCKSIPPAAAVGILLIYFLCNIVQCVLCACLSGLEESHPSGDSDFLLLALPG